MVTSKHCTSLTAFSTAILLAAFVASPLMAQHTVFYSDFRNLGRLDGPSTVGNLAPSSESETTSIAGGLALLPSGELLWVGNRVESFDPQALTTAPITDLDVFCFDATADADGNVWCVYDDSIYCLEAGTYTRQLSVEHLSLAFRGVAALGPRLYAAAYFRDDYGSGLHLFEINRTTGAASFHGPLPLPPEPLEFYFFELNGMSFDAAGDLWLGLSLYFPSVILPTPGIGYLTRILDPLDGAIAKPAQALAGSTTPSPVVIGAPTVVDIPAVGTTGLSILTALLIMAGLAIIVRQP